MKQKYITREQKKQVNRFLQQIYGFPFKAGGAYLCGAGFEKQGLYTSVYTLQKQAIRRIQYSGAAYISLNIFKPRQGHCRRAEKYLWRFNHIVIDIDFQQNFSPDYEAVEQELEQQIRWHGTYGDAPMPNAIVFTGSGGCHLYYIFEDLPNGKGGRMAEGIQAVKTQLLARWVQIEKTLQDEGMDFHVDTQAIDASRVFRIPGSIHRDTGRMCWMKPLRSTPYGYKELCRCLNDVPWNGAYAVANARRDIERARFGYGQSDRRSEPYTMTKQFLGAKRLRELLRLAHAGWGFQDSREDLEYLFQEWEMEQDPEELIRESMAPVRQAGIGPMLVGRKLEELCWEPIRMDDPRVTAHPDWLKEFRDFAWSDLDSLTLHQSARIERTENGFQTWIYNRMDYDALLVGLEKQGLSLPTADEWAYLCGGGCRTLFPWGDGMDYSMRLHWFEDLDKDEDRPYDMEEPNFFGLSIAYDPYMREIVKADVFTTCGGDGGCNICGGLGIFLGFLPCSPHCKPAVQEDKELNGDYDFYRPIIQVEMDG